MSFIYPLFLIAGVALAIPVIIHLFNLRRYKTVYFPHTRFLKNIQLRSQKSSQLRYKWLLALRLLFLTFLILAFAQPFFINKDQQTTGKRLQAIYIDNSGSMSLKKGQQRVLDIAKHTARRQVKAATPGTKFVLLTNDKPVSYRPMPADKALLALANIELSARPKTAEQVLSSLKNIMQSEAVADADLYYYSDFQQSAVSSVPDEALTEHVRFMAIPLVGDEVPNVYIDTAYLTSPVLEAGVGNQLVVRTKVYGDQPKEAPVLNLSVNGQVKSAATLSFEEGAERSDTLSFRVNDAAWQEVLLTLNDASVRFDDTFRLTARSAPNLSVLVLNEGNLSPYIQAAFRAYNGFRLNNANINTPPEDWSEYSLVILNNCTRITSSLGKRLAQAQQRGQTICIFPGKTSNTNALNEGLKELGDISFSSLDTGTEAAVSIQRGSDLVNNLFESVPDNIQLPTANWHYNINAGLSANQQSVLSFRSGDPLFAHYAPNLGDLYILSTGIDPQAGNFASSYFFAPFLYQMAIQANGGNAYALTLGSNQPAYLPLQQANERNMIRIIDGNRDAIPSQRTQGIGLNVYVDDVVTSAGYYPLVADNTDTTTIAVNLDRAESDLSMADMSNLKSRWQNVDMQILDADDITSASNTTGWDGFPLWKVCVILALIMLAAETWVLANSLRKPTAATQ